MVPGYPSSCCPLLRPVGAAAGWRTGWQLGSVPDSFLAALQLSHWPVAPTRTHRALMDTNRRQEGAMQPVLLTFKDPQLEERWASRTGTSHDPQCRNHWHRAAPLPRRFKQHHSSSLLQLDLLSCLVGGFIW